MKLISLDITNFRVIKKARIEFPDKVIGIIGPNGAGKSSIIEAISYALYGNQSARTGKDEIKGTYAQPGEDCRVELEFLINEGKYKVIRKLIGKTERAEVELYYNDATESVGVNETKNYVGELLGLDWRGFLSSFLARQSELNALSDLTPTKRRDHIAGMLGIERLDKAIEKVKKESRFLKDRSGLLEKMLAEKETTTVRIAELGRDKTTLAPKLDESKQQLDSARTALNEATVEYEQIQKQKDSYVKLNGQLDSEQKTLITINERLEKLTAEKAELESLKNTAAELEDELKNLPELKAKLDRLRELKNRQEESNQLQTELQELAQGIKAFEEKIAQAEKVNQDNIDELSKYPTDLDDQLNKLKADIESLRENYSHKKADTQTIYNERQRIANQLKSVGELGPDSVCDRCLRPMGDDFGKITEHLKKDLAEFDKKYATASAELSETETNGKRLAEEQKQIEQQLNRRNELQANLDKINGELKLNRDYSKNQQTRLSQIEERLSKIQIESFSLEDITKTELAYNDLLEKKSQFDRITGRVKRYDDVLSDIENLNGKSTESEKTVGQLTEEIKATSYSEERFERAKAKFNQSQDAFDQKKDDYQGLAKQLELIDMELRLKKEQEATFEKTTIELEQSRDDHYHLEKLTNLFSDYRKELIASIRPTLANSASRLLNQMTDSRYSLVELDEKYNLRVHDSGQFYGVDRFSGGEKDLANLCLRLAISEALTDSAGLDSSFVILDEVFGSQDSERKELILSALANLKTRFPQILLISHIEDVKNGVEELIEVRPTGLGWSEVFVNEQKV